MALPDDTRDRRIIADDRSWPLVTRLPMKQFAEQGYGDLGYLIRGQGPTVFDHSGLPKAKFASLDEMLDAGWRVD